MRTFRQCSSCGTQLAEDMAYCPTCGAPTPHSVAAFGIVSDGPTEASPPPDPQAYKPATDYGSPPYGAPLQDPYKQYSPYGPISPPPPPPRRGRSGLIIGIISAVAASIVVLGIVGIFALLTLRGGSSSVNSISSSPVPTAPATPSQVPAQGCGGAFSDEFNGNLDSRWNWINPNGSATHSLATEGVLSISTPPGGDINSGANFNAPRLLQPISGNFTVETLVTFSGTAFFQSAGILLWQDQTQFLRFELGYWGTKYGIVFQKGENGLFSGDLVPWDRHLSSARPIALRVQRQGDHFTVAWHEPGQAWQIDGETDMHFASLMVGLDLIATVNAPQTTAYYDYFRVSCI